MYRPSEESDFQSHFRYPDLLQNPKQAPLLLQIDNLLPPAAIEALVQNAAVLPVPIEVLP